jgi:hypothetical protein
MVLAIEERVLQVHSDFPNTLYMYYALCARPNIRVTETEVSRHFEWDSVSLS